VRHTLRRAVVLAPIAVAALLLASPARGQWVTLGRKALGKIQTMTQTEKTGAPGYSVATVVLAGAADKVFSTALKTVQGAPKVKLTHQDAAKLTLEFTDGKQVYGLRVSQVDSKLVQVLIVSSVPPDGTDAVPAVVAATLRVCKEVGVGCEVVK